MGHFRFSRFGAHLILEHATLVDLTTKSPHFSPLLPPGVCRVCTLVSFFALVVYYNNQQHPEGTDTHHIAQQWN